MSDSEKSKGNGGLDYMGVLFSRWWLIAIGTFAWALIAACVSLTMSNVYEASAVILITPPQFKTGLRPEIFPAQTYKRMLESKGLLYKVLEKMREKYPEDFEKVTAEDLLSSCKIEIEAIAKAGSAGESPLLVLFAKHVNPEYAMEISNTWAQEFVEFNRLLQKTRTDETDHFISEQYQETERKLTLAEKAVTDFNDEAQIDAFTQQFETVSAQARTLFTQLENQREDLALEKQNLAVVEEQIGAVEVNGRWLGESAGKVVNLSKMNAVQRGIVSELLRTATRYREATDNLASLAKAADVETLKRQLSSCRTTLIESNRALREAQSKHKSLEAMSKALSTQLAATKQVIALKRSLPEEVFWGKVLDRPSASDIRKLSEMHLISEVFNPDHIQLSRRVLSLKEELEKAASEEKYLTEKIPQLEDEVKDQEARLQILRKKQTDLMTFHRETQNRYESRYKEYIFWLDERGRRRIEVAGIEHSMAMLEERYNERLAQMRSLGTSLARKHDKLEQLKRNVEVAKYAYELLKNKVEDARIAVAQERKDVSLVSSAIMPGKKVAPHRSLITTAAAIVGFLLSMLAIILSEYRAQVVK